MILFYVAISKVEGSIWVGHIFGFV